MQAAERLSPSTDLPPNEAVKHLQKMQRLVSRYESGDRRIDVLELWLICRVLGVSFVELTTELDGLFTEAENDDQT